MKRARQSTSDSGPANLAAILWCGAHDLKLVWQKLRQMIGASLVILLTSLHVCDTEMSEWGSRCKKIASSISVGRIVKVGAIAGVMVN